MTLRSSARIRSRPSATFSALPLQPTIPFRGSSMREGVDDLVDAHAICRRGELDVTRIFCGVRPLPAVAHVGVPVDEDHRAAGVVENGAQMLHDSAALTRTALEERAETRGMR